MEYLGTLLLLFSRTQRKLNLGWYRSVYDAWCTPMIRTCNFELERGEIHRNMSILRRCSLWRVQLLAKTDKLLTAEQALSIHYSITRLLGTQVRLSFYFITGRLTQVAWTINIHWDNRRSTNTFDIECILMLLIAASVRLVLYDVCSRLDSLSHTWWLWWLLIWWSEFNSSGATSIP